MQHNKGPITPDPILSMELCSARPPQPRASPKNQKKDKERKARRKRQRNRELVLNSGLRNLTDLPLKLRDRVWDQLYTKKYFIRLMNGLIPLSVRPPFCYDQLYEAVKTYMRPGNIDVLPAIFAKCVHEGLKIPIDPSTTLEELAAAVREKFGLPLDPKVEPYTLAEWVNRETLPELRTRLADAHETIKQLRAELATLKTLAQPTPALYMGTMY